MMRLVLVLLLASCNGAFDNLRPRESVSPQEAFNLRWAGHSEDDIIVHYGKPVEVLMLSTGNRVDSYHTDVSYSTSRAGVYGNVGSASADATTVFCERRFEIDKTTAKVMRAVIMGTACDYAR